jgi:hypothetical protein
MGGHNASVTASDLVTFDDDRRGPGSPDVGGEIMRRRLKRCREVILSCDSEIKWYEWLRQRFDPAIHPEGFNPVIYPEVGGMEPSGITSLLNDAIKFDKNKRAKFTYERFRIWNPLPANEKMPHILPPPLRYPGS